VRLHYKDQPVNAVGEIFAAFWRIGRDTFIHSVDKMQNLFMLKQAVHVLIIVFSMVNVRGKRGQHSAVNFIELLCSPRV
jgi:hypothetical protein